MNFQEKLAEELKYLSAHDNKAITINNTAKYETNFRILPRRYALDTAISSFLINDSKLLHDTLRYFDGKVETIFVDVEQKLEINLFKVAKDVVKQSRLIAIKPNDMAIEACDLLIRHEFRDDLMNKNVLVIGTGNLASKIALRMSERQANVFIKGRSKEKEHAIVNGLNGFLPAFSPEINTMEHLQKISLKADVIVSFLSGQFEEEELLFPYISQNTFIIDGGISNFSQHFISQMMEHHTTITRLDVRIALPYQFISAFHYTTSFFENVYGKSELNQIPVVSGGFVGPEGTVIVDNIRQPNQIVGIADGMGGVKHNEYLTESDRRSIQDVQKTITTGL
ncbi:hypothetical protein ACW2QC_01290 [Virgibacillus sp. FSP13]